jgi:hypothetical protein
MSKEKFLRLYVKLSIMIGIILFIWMFVFTNQFPPQFNGTVEKNIFAITLNNSFVGPKLILNSPLIVFISFLLLNIYFVFRIGNTEEVKNKWLKEVLFYNIILTIMMIMGQVLFAIMVPETIQGAITDHFVYLSMPMLNDSVVQVINVNYVMTIAMIIYNILVAWKSALPKEKVVQEEIILQEVHEFQDDSE